MKHVCCGCSACALVCPTKAIKMEVNKDGFYVANIDKEKCINCGLCDKICIYNKEEAESGVPIANKGLYSAYTKSEEERSECSSGGIANEIAKQFIEKEYAVLGVIYDQDQVIAKHIIVSKNNMKDLEKIKGSKYLQSNNYEAFNEIVTSKQKAVIFGTPCQIAGIAKTLELLNIRDKFILIDIFCHGVPSYNLWTRYLEYIGQDYNIGNKPNVIFRDKKKGWHEYHIKIYSDKDVYENERKKMFFIDVF